jgi:hypothetical protein
VVRIVTTVLGRAMSQAVSRRPLTAEARVRPLVSPCGICGGQSGTGTRFSPEYFGFLLSILLHRCFITRKKKKLIIFITGLHNKTQDCGASVGSAAGPFTIKKYCFKAPKNLTCKENTANTEVAFGINKQIN